MGQKLILPVNQCKLTASMKTSAYIAKFGYTHYGIDMVSTAGNRTLWASGDGVVIAVGSDDVVGNVLAIIYHKAYDRVSGWEQDLIFRYFHLESIDVKQGERVNKNTKLGVYGNTGSMSMAWHLHLEADTDTEHPLFSPTVGSSSFLKGRAHGATDKTMSSPLNWLHCKTDAPDYQAYVTAEDDFIRQEDKTIAQITGTLDTDRVGIEGIDISKHNGAVDWEKVRAAGKQFAFIRVGWAGWDGHIEANGGLDPTFHKNMRGALAAGLDVGVYVYSYCKIPAAAAVAAYETLELIRPYNLRYPVAFDIEDTSDSGVRYDKMGKGVNSAIADAFLTVVEDAGYCPMLYTYKSFAESYLDMEELSRWDLWIAQYAAVCTYKGAYNIWQYKGGTGTFSGSCEGVTGSCDLNTAYKDYAARTESAAAPVSFSASQEDAEALKNELEALRSENARMREEIGALSKKWPASV